VLGRPGARHRFGRRTSKAGAPRPANHAMSTGFSYPVCRLGVAEQTRAAAVTAGWRWRRAPSYTRHHARLREGAIRGPRASQTIHPNLWPARALSPPMASCPLTVQRQATPRVRGNRHRMSLPKCGRTTQRVAARRQTQRTPGNGAEATARPRGPSPYLHRHIEGTWLANGAREDLGNRRGMGWNARSGATSGGIGNVWSFAAVSRRHSVQTLTPERGSRHLCHLVRAG
jgi:hypothetical protein